MSLSLRLFKQAASRRAGRLLQLALLGFLVHGLMGNAQAQSRSRAPVKSARVETTAPAAPPAVAAVPAQQASPYEQQLQAIRQALLEATMQAPTQVISTSWIDDMGALRESQQYNSKAEVRKVRLLPWIQNEADDAPAPRAAAEVLPWGWRLDPKAQAAASCEPPPRVWRTPLAIESLLAPGFAGEQQAAAQALVQGLRQHLQDQVQQGQRWTPVERQITPGSTYLRALLAAPPDPATDWQAHLRLEPVRRSTSVDGQTQGLAPALRGSWFGSTAPWAWNLHLSLRPRNAGRDASAGWQRDWHFSVDADQAAQHPSRWLPALQAELATQMSSWLAQVQMQDRCEPAQFAVRNPGGRDLQLMAGQGSGLRSGDRVLIMQPGWVPSRMLDPRAADHLALAEVVRIGARHTDIRQLAGPPLPTGGDWVALPL